MSPQPNMRFHLLLRVVEEVDPAVLIEDRVGLEVDVLTVTLWVHNSVLC
ncbi:uncharacterized protein G2W53_037290 [Senna tora]|uniref:Uncharacterized protein n=1 Tax=Senna tora TaxID=362788 RepID=A0A834W5Y2_9FABA|nr:uncharacterized protein G2W53_037290 [Senna tora]